jgi:hypothetical protein
MHADEERLSRKDSREWETKIDRYLSASRNVSAWKRPSESKDKLIDTPDGKGSEIPHPKGNARRHRKPRVFHGPIGAANMVLGDPAKREALRVRWKIKAIEMEGYGVADASWVANVGYLVVRGTCDYCNATKNDDWHRYAALIAAAYACTVVEYLHPVGRRPLDNLSAIPQTPPTLPEPGGVVPGLKPLGPSAFATGKLQFTDKGTPPTTEEAPHLFSVTRPQPSTQSIEPQNISGATSIPLVGSPAASTEHRRVRELNERLRLLIREGQATEFKPLAEELEKLASSVPRVGSEIREAWILLADIERRNQLRESQAGRPVDVTRLRLLREEAKRVID